MLPIQHKNECTFTPGVNQVGDPVLKLGKLLKEQSLITSKLQ